MPSAQIKVSHRAADRWESGHPWIYVSDVTDTNGAQPGEVVQVVNPRGKFLGIAHYSSTSQIALRLLTRRNEPIDAAFLRARIKAAVDYRHQIIADSDAYRVIFSEADALPGLIVDRYADTYVLQALDQGMDAMTSLIRDCLSELVSPSGILARNDASVRRLEGLPQTVETLAGAVPERVEIRMNGLRLEADLLKGQKTGVYLDQRENYVAAAKYARGRVLDCFTSTGGFALHMAGKVESVEAIDSSALAIQAAKSNAALNSIANVEWREADVFDYLSGLGRKFDTIVLDPPAFAKTRRQIDDAVRGYKEINLRALKLLNPGGVLITCSCSHHMSEALLYETVAGASLDAGKTLRVLERRTQSSDHPILLTVPETLYLKCLIVQSV